MLPAIPRNFRMVWYYCASGDCAEERSGISRCETNSCHRVPRIGKTQTKGSLSCSGSKYRMNSSVWREKSICIMKWCNIGGDYINRWQVDFHTMRIHHSNTIRVKCLHHTNVFCFLLFQSKRQVQVRIQHPGQIPGNKSLILQLCNSPWMPDEPMYFDSSELYLIH